MVLFHLLRMLTLVAAVSVVACVPALDVSPLLLTTFFCYRVFHKFWWSLMFQLSLVLLSILLLTVVVVLTVVDVPGVHAC